MPQAYYEPEFKTIVRISLPTHADNYPNGSVRYVAGHTQAEQDGARFKLINISNDPSVLLLKQIKIGRIYYPAGQPCEAISHYQKLYPNSKLLIDQASVCLEISDPQEILLIRLTNMDRFF